VTKLTKTTGTGTDYGQATADALNTWSPERTASYRKWPEYLGPECTTETGKADLAQMLAEETATAKDGKAE
jgi:hypothetical protein